MDTTASISISTVGKKTGKPYNGVFVAKMVKSQRDEFLADAVRREILGPSPEGTYPAPKLQGDAYILGQLRVRLLQFPDWWKDSQFGLDLEDDNVAQEILAAILKRESDATASLKTEVDSALKELKSKTKKE